MIIDLMQMSWYDRARGRRKFRVNEEEDGRLIQVPLLSSFGGDFYSLTLVLTCFGDNVPASGSDQGGGNREHRGCRGN